MWRTGSCDQFADALEDRRRSMTPLIADLADLADVEFFDASGLRALLSAHDSSPRWGAPLRIVASAPVSLVIDLIEARGLFALYPDRGRALAEATTG